MIQRDILKTIETRLDRAGENGAVILHGMPCVGKSTLMKQIAAIPDIFWRISQRTVNCGPCFVMRSMTAVTIP